MASIFGHPAFPMAVNASGIRIPKKLLIICILLTLVPDADVIAFRFGIPYESQWGHRGFTHSITFAVFIGLMFAPFAASFQTGRWKVFLLTSLSTLSHALLDALTNGGLGVALLWPFTSERYFFPLRPIEVSPIGVRGFLSLRGLVVVMSEIFWVWLPALFFSAFVRKLLRRQG